MTLWGDTGLWRHKGRFFKQTLFNKKKNAPTLETKCDEIKLKNVKSCGWIAHVKTTFWRTNIEVNLEEKLPIECLKLNIYKWLLIIEGCFLHKHSKQAHEAALKVGANWCRAIVQKFAIHSFGVQFQFDFCGRPCPRLPTHQTLASCFSFFEIKGNCRGGTGG